MINFLLLCEHLRRINDDGRQLNDSYTCKILIVFSAVWYCSEGLQYTNMPHMKFIYMTESNFLKRNLITFSEK